MNNHEAPAVEYLYYNRWANLTLIAACSGLTRDQLASSVPGTYGSIYDTLVHIIRGEAGYYRLLTGTRLVPPFSWDQHPTVAEMQPYAEQVSSALIEAAPRMNGTDLLKEDWEGQILQYRPITVFIQVLNHGVEHRTNITTIMVQQGLQPPDIDGWGYMLANQDRVGP